MKIRMKWEISVTIVPTSTTQIKRMQILMEWEMYVTTVQMFQTQVRRTLMRIGLETCVRKVVVEEVCKWRESCLSLFLSEYAVI